MEAAATLTAMRYVPELAARLATVIVDTIVDVLAGTVYKVVSVVAAGADCPSTLYVVAIVYAPINRNDVGIGSCSSINPDSNADRSSEVRTCFTVAPVECDTADDPALPREIVNASPEGPAVIKIISSLIVSGSTATVN